MKLFPYGIHLLSLLLALNTQSQTELPSWALGPFTRPDHAQPVIQPNPEPLFDCPLTGKSVAWEMFHTFNPAAVVYHGQINVLYRAEGDVPGATKTHIGGYISRVGLAVSDDGIKFTPELKPVYAPGEDPQKDFESKGSEDPRVVTGPDGLFVLLFTQFSSHGVRLGLATSKDLHNWTKHGSPFTGTPFEDAHVKSASIVQKVAGDHLEAAQINGKYWMFFGENCVNLASSDDLIHWAPLDDGGGHMKAIMKTRTGFFDSGLTECGPPSLLTDNGIILIYNGKNRNPAKDGDPTLPSGVYTCGQALFDKSDPSKYLTRLDHPFFKPELDWEKSGQYKAGTTFAEGLVLFKDKWFLYYGCADTFVGVATAPNTLLKNH